MIKASLNAFVDQAGTGDSDPVLNAVVIYNSLSSGKSASRTLNGALREISEFQIHAQAWRLDLLEDLSWRDFARQDVTAADIVFISATSIDAFPDWFQSWLRGCLSKKGDRPGAMVALLGIGEDGDLMVMGQLLWLEEAAREAGWEFFSSIAQEEQGNLSSGLKNAPQRRSRVNVPVQVFPIVLSEPLNQSTYRHWGINE